MAAITNTNITRQIARILDTLGLKENLIFNKSHRRQSIVLGLLGLAITLGPTVARPEDHPSPIISAARP